LGAAAEKALQKTNKRYTDSLCKNLPPTINEEYCGKCDWQDFCSARKPKSPSTGSTIISYRMMARTPKKKSCGEA
jgi:hypothetical protein